MDSYYYLGMIAEIENDIKQAADYFTKAKGCHITALNTVKAEQIEEKYRQYNHGDNTTSEETA